MSLNPKHTDAYNNLGKIFYENGKFQEAVTHYQKAIEIEPNFSDAYFNLGNSLIKTGSLRSAIECYMTSLKIVPSDTEVLGSCGKALEAYGSDTNIKNYIFRGEIKKKEKLLQFDNRENPFNKLLSLNIK